MFENKTINKTKDQECIVVCAGNCKQATYHKVVSSLDLDGHVYNQHVGDFYWDTSYQIIECQGCKAISFRKTHSDSENLDFNADDEMLEPIETSTLYPSRIEGRTDLGYESKLLPPQIQIIYQETLQALNAYSPVLAGVGLRAIIETVCKEKSAEGRNLYEKIDDLVEKKILTPSGASILHKIRTLGNKAAHEVTPHSAEQLGLAMEVAEHILKDVYILPKRMDSDF